MDADILGEITSSPLTSLDEIGSYSSEVDDDFRGQMPDMLEDSSKDNTGLTDKEPPTSSPLTSPKETSSSQGSLVTRDVLINDDQALGQKRPALTTPLPVSKRPRQSTEPIPGFIRKAQLLHPMPYSDPPVWARDRQALCESLPYYPSCQCIAYAADKTIRGILLEKDPWGRIHMDEEVIICRVSSRFLFTRTDGTLGPGPESNAKDPSIDTFRRNIQQYVSIVVIASNDVGCGPSQLQYEYNVLAHFQLTHVWVEINGKATHISCRLEKIDRETRSWWARKKSPEPRLPLSYTEPATRKTCVLCKIESTQVYKVGWMCLNETCEKFWLVNQSKPSDLVYNPQFIRERTPWPRDVQPAYELLPMVEDWTKYDPTSLSPSKVCWRGLVCPKCRRCTSRKYWDSWHCEEEGCEFGLELRQPVFSHRSLMDGHEVEYGGHALPLNKFVPPITIGGVQFLGSWRATKYELGDRSGNFVIHFQASAGVNKVPGGAHELLKELQTDTQIGLERCRVVRTNEANLPPEEELAMSFTANYGLTTCEPYSERKPLNNAPPSILNALHRLNWAARTVVGTQNFIPFNGIKAQGHLADGKTYMNPDSDTNGIGLTTAVLALGGGALMTFRMKKLFYNAFNNASDYDPQETILPGSPCETERKELNNKYGNLPTVRFLKLVQEFLKKNGRTLRKNPPDFLTLKVLHGDIVVIHGNMLHQFYEHNMASTGKMRFNLSARYLDPLVAPIHDQWKRHYDDDVRFNHEGTLESLLKRAVPAE